MLRNEMEIMLNNIKERLDKEDISITYYTTAYNNDIFVDVKLKDKDGYNKSTAFIMTDDIEEELESFVHYFKCYVYRMKLEAELNKELDKAKDKFEALKCLVSCYSDLYSLCIRYDLLGVLELKKANKNSITALDNLDNKVYLKAKDFEKLYTKGDTIKLYELY